MTATGWKGTRRGYEATGTPLLDLIQEGNLGLMQAVQRFDPTKGLPVHHLRHVVGPQPDPRAAGRRPD